MMPLSGPSDAYVSKEEEEEEEERVGRHTTHHANHHDERGGGRTGWRGAYLYDLPEPCVNDGDEVFWVFVMGAHLFDHLGRECECELCDY